MRRPELDLTEADGQQALRAHVVERALQARARFGPRIDADAMRRLVADRAVVRFETQVVFDAAPLQPGEFGWAMPLGERPHHGFALVLHPALEAHPDDWPLCAAYHLVSINYLDVATSAEAEAFGAALFGLEVDAYYRRLCALADSLPNAVGAHGHAMPGELPAPAPPAPPTPTAATGPTASDPVADFLAAAGATPAGGACGCGSSTNGCSSGGPPQ